MKPMLRIDATCVLSLLGGQLNGAMNDETLISELLNGFKESVLAQDIDRFVSLFSENHSDAQATSRENVREVMTTLMDSDALYNLELPIEEAKTVINDDGTATVFPVKIRGLWIDLDQGNAPYRLLQPGETGIFAARKADYCNAQRSVSVVPFAATPRAEQDTVVSRCERTRALFSRSPPD